MTPNWTGSRFPVVAVSRVAEIQLGKMLQPAPATSADKLAPYLRAGSLSRLDTDEYPEMFASQLDRRKYEVLEGDLLVAEGGDVGRAEFAKAVPAGTIIQNSLHRLRSQTADARFIKYALDAVYSSGWLEVYCSRSTFGHLTREKLAALTIPTPSPAGQRAISDYLDAETARIGELIRMKSDLLGLTATRRVAFVAAWIARRPEATPRADLPWLAAAPTSWPCVPLGLLADVFNGTTPERQEEEAGDIAWTTSGDIDQGLITVPTAYISEPVRRAHGLRVAPEGSIVVGLVGQGRTRGLSAALAISTTLNQNLAAVCSRDHRLEPAYLGLMLELAYDDLRNGGRGGNQAALNCEMLKAYRIPVAPPREQRQLVDTVKVERSRDDVMTALLKRSLDLLVERRQALILAAVTGRLDIPGVAA